MMQRVGAALGARVALEALRDNRWPVGILAAVVAAGVGGIAYVRLRRRPSAEEVERQRRVLIHTTGKIGDGEVLDVDGANVLYTYSVAGVGYTVSQDVSAVMERVPAERMTVIGPVLVKFLPRNPANSIVVCEDWTGFRRIPGPPATA